MSKLVTALVLLVSGLGFSQGMVVNTPYALDAKHKTSPVLVLLPLDFKVEIDGHTYDNKNAEDPIKFKATLKGVEIYDSKRKYTYRECDKDGCDIVHLEKEHIGNLNSSYWHNSNLVCPLY